MSLEMAVNISHLNNVGRHDFSKENGVDLGNQSICRQCLRKGHDDCNYNRRIDPTKGSNFKV